VGSGGGGTDARPAVLSGYIVISADDLESAVTLAKYCPGLQTWRGVEVCEVIAS